MLLISAVLLQQLIIAITNKSQDGLYYAIALFVAAVLAAIFNAASQHLLFRSAQRLRALATSLVFRKALSINTAATAGLTTGTASLPCSA